MTAKPALPAQLPKTVDDAFPSPYLKAEDLPTGGVVCQISRIVWDWLKPQTEWELKALIFFSKAGQEGKKALILNKTQAEELEAITGTGEIAAWTGHVVQLARARAQSGKATIAITRAPAQPAKPAAVAQPTPGRSKSANPDDPF